MTTSNINPSQKIGRRKLKILASGVAFADDNANLCSVAGASAVDA
jgi:hypothetical protein